MLENELEIIWQNSTKVEVVKFNKSKLLIDLDSQLKSFDRSLKKRDRREIIAAALVILIFGTGAFFFTNILSRLGMVLGALYGGLVIYVFKNVKKHRPTNNALPIKDYLVEYRQYLAKERNLIANVIYWYLLPPFIACLLFFIGQNMSITQLAVYMLIIFCIYAFIFFLNKLGVNKSFDPLIKKLDEAINDIDKIE